MGKEEFIHLDTLKVGAGSTEVSICCNDGYKDDRCLEDSGVFAAGIAPRICSIKSTRHQTHPFL